MIVIIHDFHQYDEINLYLFFSLHIQSWHLFYFFIEIKIDGLEMDSLFKSIWTAMHKSGRLFENKRSKIFRHSKAIFKIM